MPKTSGGSKGPRQELGLVLDPHSALSLQRQIRHKLIEAMSRGLLRPGRRLPSTRRLARQIGVSRNTVTLAYDALLAAGHLVSRARSGIFVAPNVEAERLTTGRRGLRHRSAREPAGAVELNRSEEFRRPPNWQEHPYPFLDGCVDPTLVPTEEWREALRIAVGKRDLAHWGSATHELDDAHFSRELRSSVLPAWGIEASADELLCAASPRQALTVVMDALVPRHAFVATDAAVDGDTRRRLATLQAQAVPLSSLLESGTLELPPRALVLLGARRLPGTAPMTREFAERLLEAAARSEALVIECATIPEIPAARRGIPSLRALDPAGRVILVGAPAAAVSLGTAPGVINAARPLVERLREARRIGGGELAAGLQRAWAYFIGLGHYATATSRVSALLQKRRTALRDALNHYLHKFVTIQSAGGASAYWVGAGAGLDAEALAHRAATVGVLIEPLAEFGHPNLFSMGVSSLPAARIREGVERLAAIVRQDPKLASRGIRTETVPMLRGHALRRAMAGRTLLYSTVYGEPCTIQVRADGALVGRAGYANEDRDTGRWWIEGDRWFRQWHSWAYGETAGFYTVIEGDQVRWFKEDGVLADTAVIVRRNRARDMASDRRA